MLDPFSMYQDVILDEDDVLESMQSFGHYCVALPRCRWCAHDKELELVYAILGVKVKELLRLLIQLELEK